MSILAVLLLAMLVGLGTLVYGVSVYNNLVRLSRAIDQSFGNIDVMLKQRREEIPKLVDACRAYLSHERDLLEEITRLRASGDGARTPEAAIRAENRLSEALGRLRMTLEAYPDLKANQNVMQIQSRVTDLESTLADRRELFNDVVTRHNIYLAQFPQLLLARAFGQKERSLLVIPEADKKDPAVFADTRR